MSETDLIKLYSKQILALASSIKHLEKIDDPQGEAKARSPLCGSMVSVCVDLKDRSIVRFSQNVKACALGQASAAIMGNVIIGLDETTIQNGRNELHMMLSQNGPIPSAPFEGYEVLLPARDFKNRHASILLAFDATLAAIKDTQ